MTARYHANVPSNQKPIFPKRCIVCGEGCEESQVIMCNPKASYWGGWEWLSGNSKRIEVFGHTKCTKKLKPKLLYRALIMFIAFDSILVFMHYELNPYIYFPLVLTVVGIIHTYQIKKPTPFEAQEVGDIIAIEFENKKIAHEFAELNQVEIY